MSKATKSTQERAEWATLVWLFVGYAGYYLCRANLSVTRTDIIDEFKTVGFTKETIGLITSIGTLLYAGGKFLAGPLCLRFGAKNMFLTGMAGAIVFTVLFGLGGGFPIFLFAWCGNRFLQSFGWAGLVETASKWFPAGRYGRVMGVLSLSFLVGDFVPKLLFGELLKQGWGWRAIFFLAAGMLVTIFGLVAWRLSGTPSELGLPEPESSPTTVLSEDDQTARDVLASLFRSPTFWVVCVLSFGFTFLRETFNEWTPTYLHEVAKLGKGEASQAASLFPLFGAFSVLVVGWLADRVGSRGRAWIVGGGLALASVGLFLLASGTFPPATIVATVAAIAFVLIGPYSLLAGAISLDLGGKRASGTACGWIDGVGYVGGILSGKLIADLATRSGWGSAMMALAITAIISAGVAVAYSVVDARRLASA